MLQAWAALLGAALTVAGCYAAGSMVVAWSGAKVRRVETFFLNFVVGAACVHLAVFAVMTLKVAYKPVWWALLGGVIAAALYLRTPRVAEAPAKRDWALVVFGAVVFAPYTVLYFVNAWAPEISPDGAGYHLEIVAKYLRAHGFLRIPTNFYADLSQGVEMLFEPAFAIGRHSAAALVHFAFLIALALGMFAYGCRIGKKWAGAAAAALVYASPVVGRDGTSAYIDVAVAAIVFAVFYWLELWDEQREWKLLVPLGLLAGYAYAAKYTAFIILPYALVFVAWKARRLRPVLLVGACAVVMMAPWMIKDWVYVHNPVAPFADEIFPNAYVHPLPEQMWAQDMRRYEVANLWTLPWQVSVDGGKTQGIIGPVFLLAPLAFFALRFREGRRLLMPGFLMLAVYFGNIGTRFLIPALPFFALAMAIAVNWRVVLAAIVLLQAGASWMNNPLRYSNPYLWRIETFPYKAALRITPLEQYLQTKLFQYDVVRMIEENVPQGERVFSLTGFATSYTTRDVAMVFPGALNNTLNDILFTGWMAELQPTRAFLFRFPEQATHRMRVVQTAQGQGQEQWNIHELRFFDHGVEVPRAPEWKLKAWPNPWEVQLAFDNSAATRWRSWQTGSPGMYIDVDFGRGAKVDEVRMESSRDFAWAIRFEVQEMDAQGRWIKVADKFEDQTMKAAGSIRRAATYELAARGFHYLVVGNEDWGAEDYADDPEAWGLEVIARTRAGTTLYKVIQ